MAEKNFKKILIFLRKFTVKKKLTSENNFKIKCFTIQLIHSETKIKIIYFDK